MNQSLPMPADTWSISKTKAILQKETAGSGAKFPVPGRYEIREAEPDREFDLRPPLLEYPSPTPA